MAFHFDSIPAATTIKAKESKVNEDFSDVVFSFPSIQAMNAPPLSFDSITFDRQSLHKIPPPSVSSIGLVEKSMQPLSISDEMESESGSKPNVENSPPKLASLSTTVAPHHGNAAETVDTLLSNYDRPRVLEADLLRQIVILCFLANICLLGAKIYISFISRSLSAIACTIDSLMDVLSGILILLTRRFILSKENLEFDRKYPAGRNLLEPVCSIVYATIMGSVSVQLCFFLIQQLFETSSVAPKIDMSIIFVLFFTILIKVILWVFCARLSKSRGDYLNVLSNDHGADILTNFIAFVVINILFQWEDIRILDNLGALLIAGLASIAWIRSDHDQIRVLAGYKADPEFYKVLYAIVNQFEEITLDDIKAYHFGVKYIVEVDVVMDPSTTVKDYVRNEQMMRNTISKLPMVHQCFVSTNYQKRNTSAYREFTSFHVPRLRTSHRSNLEIVE